MAREVADIDHGWRAAMAAMNAAAARPGAAVLVGWPEKKGGKQHKGSPLTVAEIAAIHEFGVKNKPRPDDDDEVRTKHSRKVWRIPPRSMLRDTLTINDAKYREASRQIGIGITLGKITQRKGLDLLGVIIKGDIQQRIANRIAPGNADSTKARKGSDVPLIDTGQMRASIDHEVRGV